MKSVVMTVAAPTLVTMLVVLMLATACTPLPVPHPERWAPDYGVTEYAGKARDAGRD